MSKRRKQKRNPNQYRKGKNKRRKKRRIPHDDKFDGDIGRWKGWNRREKPSKVETYYIDLETGERIDKNE